MIGELKSRLGRWASPRRSFDASELHIGRANAQSQGHDHCPAGDCTAIRRGGTSDHKFNIAPNLLDRDFSCVWTREGWLYLAVNPDLHSPRVIGIGRAVSNRMQRDLAIRALNMTISIRTPPQGCIHHTDRAR